VCVLLEPSALFTYLGDATGGNDQVLLPTAYSLGWVLQPYRDVLLQCLNNAIEATIPDAFLR
jgi:hypothetical protein